MPTTNKLNSVRYAAGHFAAVGGDPFIDGGGLEYLFGYAFEDEGLKYRGDWAVSREEERKACRHRASLQQPHGAGGRKRAPEGSHRRRPRPFDRLRVVLSGVEGRAEDMQI